MTSIARRINMSFWFKQFWGTICLDIVIVALIAGAFFKWRVETADNALVGLADGFGTLSR